MIQKRLHKTIQAGKTAASFFVPEKSVATRKFTTLSKAKSVILIPTFRPNNVTYILVKDILRFNPDMVVVIIDDNTPLDDKRAMTVFKKIKDLKEHSSRIIMLRTPHKHLKAGALNFGLEFLHTTKAKPTIVFTVDDDVVIAKDTLPRLITALANDKSLGAVCTAALIKNKKKNLLTRLQALEYHGFNITKLSDNGFLHGPLVMPGMLTAFRYSALRQIEGYSPDKLLEDYDITVKIKTAGYKTAIVPHALAWTYAPETLRDLSKQRIRWSYGGLIVLSDFLPYVRAIFQDIVGHLLFITLITLIFLSFLFSHETAKPSVLVTALLFMALLQFALAFIFNLIMLKSYHERDKKDWLIKFLILPEFAYSNLLSGILMGAYLFFAFNVISHQAVKMLPGLFRVQRIGQKGFSKIGYSHVWGTRS